MVELLNEQKTTAGVELPDNLKDEPMYGKVIEIGKPRIIEGGVVLEVPSFVIGSNEEGKGGQLHNLKKGDVVIFKHHTQHEINDYSVDNKMAFVSFDSVLALDIKEK